MDKDNALIRCKLELRSWPVKKPVVCLVTVTDDDDDESDSRLCECWGSTLRARLESPRHQYQKIMPSVQRVLDDIRWGTEFHELIPFSLAHGRIHDLLLDLSLLLFQTLQSSALVCCCHQDSSTRARLALQQEAVRVSSSHYLRLILHVVTWVRDFRDLPRNISSSVDEIWKSCNCAKLFWVLLVLHFRCLQRCRPFVLSTLWRLQEVQCLVPLRVSPTILDNDTTNFLKTLTLFRVHLCKYMLPV